MNHALLGLSHLKVLLLFISCFFSASSFASTQSYHTNKDFSGTVISEINDFDKGAILDNYQLGLTLNSILTPPTLTSPPLNSTLLGTSETFIWDYNGAAVEQWALYAGSSLGSYNYYVAGAVDSATTTTITGLPTNGSTIYIKLWYRIGATWASMDTTYTAASSGTPAITSPAVGSLLSGSSETFTWDYNGIAIDQWAFYAGSSPGTYNYFVAGANNNSTTTTATGLPADGSTVYIKLWYRIGATWASIDTTYTTVTDEAPAITSPAIGSHLSDSSETFTWDYNGIAVDQWAFYAGSSPGTYNYFVAGANNNSTTTTAIGLPTDGSTVYIKLWYRINTSWFSINASYNTSCKFKKDTNLQDCVPSEVNSGVNVQVNQIMYKGWRPLAIHKAPDSQINSVDIETYGHLNGHENATNCFKRHDKYWTLGDDGYAYHTWHPADDGVCTYLHEHGDNPNPTSIELATLGDQYLDPQTNLKRSSQAFKYAKGAYGSGYPPFGYAMTVYNRTHSQKRREDHFGHKVIIANGIRMAIGEPQVIGSDIYDTGIRCDWYSKIHQGSFSADAMTNNLHEYFITLVCNDGEPTEENRHPILYENIDATKNDVTKISFKTMLNWGNAYLLNEGRGVNSPPISPLGEPIQNFTDFWTQLLALEYNDVGWSGPVISHIDKVWKDVNGNSVHDPIPTSPALAGEKTMSESGSRDLELFSGFASKYRWDRWFENGSGFDDNGISHPELWAGPSGNYLQTLSGSDLKFAPYYVVKNPSRMLSKNSNDSLHLNRTVELCQSGNFNGAFCAGVNSGSRWDTSTFFNGSVRALNFKAIHLNNLGGTEDWCSDAIGESPTATANNKTCTNQLNQIHQKASTIDNGWQGYTNRDRTVCDLDNEHCGAPIIGTIERWSIKYQNNLWITKRKKAKKVDTNPTKQSHYKGAGMGYEWIINHGNDVGVQVPN